MKKKIKVIFTLSLLLNIILVGVFAGGYYKMHKWHKPGMDMSEETRDLVKKNMTASREDMREHFKEMRVHHQTLEKIISAEEFDRTDYDAVIAKILGVKNSAAHKKADVMGKTLEVLPQDERQKFARTALRMVIDERGGHKGGHKGKRKEGHSREGESRPPE